MPDNDKSFELTNQPHGTVDGEHISLHGNSIENIEM